MSPLTVKSQTPGASAPVVLNLEHVESLDMPSQTVTMSSGGKHEVGHDREAWQELLAYMGVDSAGKRTVPERPRIRHIDE